MSASQALAAARRRRGSNAPVSNPVVKQQTRVETQREPVSKININQYVVFLNNKIETIENRVNESLQKLEERIDKEISKMEVSPLGLNVTTLEQVMETQKSKINKMNGVINTIQSNYLALNTSLLSMKEGLNVLMVNESVQTDKVETEKNMETFRKTDLKNVPIMEEEECDLMEEEDTEENLEVVGEDIQPEPSTEEENLHLNLSEKV